MASSALKDVPWLCPFVWAVAMPVLIVAVALEQAGAPHLGVMAAFAVPALLVGIVGGHLHARWCR